MEALDFVLSRSLFRRKMDVNVRLRCGALPAELGVLIVAERCRRSSVEGAAIELEPVAGERSLLFLSGSGE